jgi:hypothetical protein
MKNLRLKSSVALLIAIGFCMASCSKKNDAAPNSKKISYQFKVTGNSAHLTASVKHSSLTTMAMSTMSTGDITWQSGFANVSSISFEGKNQDDNQSTDNFVEPAVYKVDLFNANQFLGNVDIAVGTYHNVDIRVELKQSGADPALYLKGTYASAKGSLPIELSFNEGSDQFEILALAKDLSVGAKDSYVAFISFHLDKLMAGISATDLDAATLTNGSILIDSHSNADIYAKIKANISGFSDADYNSNN